MARAGGSDRHIVKVEVYGFHVVVRDIRLPDRGKKSCLIGFRSEVSRLHKR
jgi:hypothetical protein